MKREGRIILALMALAASSAVAEIRNVLHYKKVNGFNHQSGIEGCQQMLDNLATEHGFSVKHSVDVGDILNLNQYDIVVFDNNSSDGGAQGILPTEASRQALKDYLEGGGLFIGIHNVIDYDGKGWQWYKDVLFTGQYHQGWHGGRFTLVPDADLLGDAELSAMWKAAGLPDTASFTTERYRFYQFPILRADPDVKVLLKQAETEERLPDQPHTWTKRIGKGRMLYTSFGHGATDFIANDKWLERATWHWMKYLDGQYGNSISVRDEGDSPKSLKQMLSGTGRVKVYRLSGQLVATYDNGLRPGLDLLRTAKPGFYFAKIESPSGVTTKKFVIP